MARNQLCQHSSEVELLICNQWVPGSNPGAGSTVTRLSSGIRVVDPVFTLDQWVNDLAIARSFIDHPEMCPGDYGLAMRHILSGLALMASYLVRSNPDYRTQIVRDYDACILAIQIKMGAGWFTANATVISTHSKITVYSEKDLLA